MENKTFIHHLEEKGRGAAIRVSLMEGGTSSPSLGLSLDEEKPQDEAFHVQGLLFIVDKGLLEQCGAINIDFIETGNTPGFKVTAANPLFSRDDTYSSGLYASRGLCH